MSSALDPLATKSPDHGGGFANASQVHLSLKTRARPAPSEAVVAALVDLPPLMPSHRLRSPARRQTPKGKKVGKPCACPPAGMSEQIEERRIVKASEGIWKMQAQLQRLLDSTDKPDELSKRSVGSGSQKIMMIRETLRAQLQAEVGCLNWVSHALSSCAAVPAAHARTQAVQNHRQWMEETSRLDHLLGCLEPVQYRAGHTLIEEVERCQSVVSRTSAASPSSPAIISDEDEDFAVVTPNTRISHLQKRLFADEAAGVNQAVQEVASTPSLNLVTPGRRGVGAGQIRVFFEKYCGDIIEEDEDSSDMYGPQPLCVASRLAEICLQRRSPSPSCASVLAPHIVSPQEQTRRSSRYEEPNVYAAVDLLIIPQTQDEQISYCEKLNPDGRDVQYLVSHHWGDDFGDLVQGLLRHASFGFSLHGYRSLEDVSYWWHAFSSNHHHARRLAEKPHDDGGHDPLHEVHAVLNETCCFGTVMCLDQLASAFRRAWCLYEVWLTRKVQKDVILISNLGPLANAWRASARRDVWASHIFRLAHHIDAAQAVAHSENDLRSILNKTGCCSTAGETYNFSALNDCVRVTVIQQVLPALVRLGQSASVRHAIDLGVNVNAPDVHGIRILSYASVCKASDDSKSLLASLLAAKADCRAEAGAEHLMSMWSFSREKRERALKAMDSLSLDICNFHEEALHRGKTWHQNCCVAELAGLLSSPSVKQRLDALRGLGNFGVAAMAHAETVGAHIVDEEPLVQMAVIETLGRMGPTFDVRSFDFKQGLVAEGQTMETHHALNGTLLQAAARSSSDNALQFLVAAVQWSAEGAPIMSLDSLQRNIVHLMVDHGHAKALRALAKVCAVSVIVAAATARDSSGSNALHFAAARGDLECLRAICDIVRTHQRAMGSNSNSLPACDVMVCSTDANKCTPIHIAALARHYDFISDLLQVYECPREALIMQSSEGHHVGHIVARHGDAEFLRLLLRLGMPIDAFETLDRWNCAPVHVAVLVDSAAVLAVIQEVGGAVCCRMGIDLPVMGSVALVPHHEGGMPSHRLGRVIYGRDRHGNVKFEYPSGLKDLKIIQACKCLFAPTPWELANMLGKERTARALRDVWHSTVHLLSDCENWIWDEARTGNTLAGAVAERRGREGLQALVDNGVLMPHDFPSRDCNGRAAIHRAAASGREDVVKAVLEFGRLSDEDRRATDLQGRNALHHLATTTAPAKDAETCLNTVLRLCFKSDHNALSLTDLHEFTPVHIAAISSPNALRALVNISASLDAPMGSSLKPVKGTMAIVPLGVDVRKPEWRLGRIVAVSGTMLQVKYPNGIAESTVERHRCIIAPTPYALAEALGSDAAKEILRNTIPAPQAASFARLAAGDPVEHGSARTSLVASPPPASSLATVRKRRTVAAVLATSRRDKSRSSTSAPSQELHVPGCRFGAS